MIKRSLIIILVLISVLIAKPGTVLASQEPPTPANLLAIERRQERQWWRYGMQAALKLPTPIPTTPAMKQAYQAGMKAMRTWQAEQPCPVGGWQAWLANLPDQRLAELMAQAELPIIIPPQPVTTAAGQPIQSACLVKHQIESPHLLTSVPLQNQIPVANRPTDCGEVEAAEPVTEHLVNPTNHQPTVAPSNHKSTLPRLTAPLNKPQQRFINHLKGPAQQIGRRYDLYPSVLIAQAALESNWGASDLAAHYHNYFGIKGTYQGHGVQLPTLEFLWTSKSFQEFKTPKVRQNEHSRTLMIFKVGTLNGTLTKVVNSLFYLVIRPCPKFINQVGVLISGCCHV
ncbi:glycoside hydrolase family 73 protein [Limosilactobacillus equigenerosi]|uniref:Mannosyl-glycoprotein endo-beta-N-acetylglucosamidase-like domain-containing protein n=3 Tax=Limosilactobacillus TaxID=2742598 RepID=A0A0R1UPP8_9LACO|nr:glucosaminidase domain-containing protein [Limosilactobacillus equigenerosi]KRL95200.1 hypothetical protein FC21_GL000788 [Limosilactobacillus equigenerosi DSM 18793 = JCM 14505]